MGSVGLRKYLAVIFVIAFLASYTIILDSAYEARIFSSNEMIKFIMQINAQKVIVFSLYAITNSLMSMSYKSRMEFEILLTGLFSLIFITVSTILHYTHIFIMPNQLNLMLFNGMSIAFYIALITMGRRYGLLGTT